MVDTDDNIHSTVVQPAVLGSELEVDMPPGGERGMEEVYKGMLEEEITTFLNQDTLQ